MSQTSTVLAKMNDTIKLIGSTLRVLAKILARPKGKFICGNWKAGAVWAGAGNAPCTKRVQ